MNTNRVKRTAAAVALAGSAALAGCAATKSAQTAEMPVYRCEQGLQFTVKFVDDTAVLKGARGDDVLLRDAGGEGAQTVYSNPRLRAEFGLGASGSEAMLHYLLRPLEARCVRD
ncbi:MAG: hypothetical protein ABIQ90_03050 [Polaromonas sp.]